MSQPSSFFDKEIAELEEERQKIEEELSQLQAGRISLNLGDKIVEMELGMTIEVNDDKTKVVSQISASLAKTLAENAVGLQLTRSFMSEQELRNELALPTPKHDLVSQNRRFNRKISRVNRILGYVSSSSWLLVVGILLLGWWLSGLFNGTATNSFTPSPNFTPTPTRLSSTPLAENKVQPVSYSFYQDIQTANEPTATPEHDQNGEERVGLPPSQAGGLNGPHGAFFAPSRMTNTALNLDVPISRAISLEVNGRVSISWPRAGEVVHFGAYPGELGNMVLLGTQTSLAPLRHLQLNDELRLYDRKGNLFIYRVIPFSSSGQSERLVNLSEDGWLFEPTSEAMLTIVVSVPQPLPAVNLDNNGSGSEQTVSRDDYTQPYQKLAYRAVLAIYAPSLPTPVGTPVAVNAAAWQVRPANTPTPTPAVTPTPLATATPVPALTPTPDQTVSLPKLPNTGDGSCSNSTSCK